nr:sigma-70 family RNA polymerase sigma factor [Neptunicella marina]
MKKSTEHNVNHPADIPADKLVTLIAAHDEQAEKLLFERYWQGLQFILARRVKEQHLIEDLAQETILLVLHKARNGEINNPKALNGFVRNTAINLLIAHQRKEIRRATSCDENIEDYPLNEPSDLSHIQYCEATLRLVEQLLSELTSARDKKILQYFYLYEKDKQQICDELVLSAAHFDRVLFRARSRLKQLMQHKISPEHNGLNAFKVFAISLISLLPFFNGVPQEYKKTSIQMRETLFAQHNTDNKLEQLQHRK